MTVFAAASKVQIGDVRPNAAQVFAGVVVPLVPLPIVTVVSALGSRGKDRLGIDDRGRQLDQARVRRVVPDVAVRAVTLQPPPVVDSAVTLPSVQSPTPVFGE